MSAMVASDHFPPLEIKPTRNIMCLVYQLHLRQWAVPSTVQE